MSDTVELRSVPGDRWSHFSAILAAELESAARSRAFVSRHLLAHQLPHLEDDIRLVATELAVNAVVHAQTSFTMTLSRTGSRVRVAATDGSPRQPRKRTTEAWEDGGYGLVVIGLLSLDWGVTQDDNDMKSVWASFDAQRGGTR